MINQHNPKILTCSFVDWLLNETEQSVTWLSMTFKILKFRRKDWFRHKFNGIKNVWLMTSVFFLSMIAEGKLINVLYNLLIPLYFAR